MYHVELRQFPHNSVQLQPARARNCARSPSRGARKGRVELGEHKWSPHQARLTIFQGPQIPLGRAVDGPRLGRRPARGRGRDRASAGGRASSRRREPTAQAGSATAQAASAHAQDSQRAGPAGGQTAGGRPSPSSRRCSARTRRHCWRRGVTPPRSIATARRASVWRLPKTRSALGRAVSELQ